MPRCCWPPLEPSFSNWSLVAAIISRMFSICEHWSIARSTCVRAACVGARNRARGVGAARHKRRPINKCKNNTRRESVKAGKWETTRRQKRQGRRRRREPLSIHTSAASPVVSPCFFSVSVPHARMYAQNARLLHLLFDAFAMLHVRDEVHDELVLALLVVGVQRVELGLLRLLRVEKSTRVLYVC